MHPHDCKCAITRKLAMIMHTSFSAARPFDSAPQHEKYRSDIGRVLKDLPSRSNEVDAVLPQPSPPEVRQASLIAFDDCRDETLSRIAVSTDLLQLVQFRRSSKSLRAARPMACYRPVSCHNDRNRSA